MLKNRAVQYTGILISLAALWFAFSDIDWRIVRDQLVLIDLKWYSLTIVLMILSIYVRAWRWKYIIKPLGMTRVYPLYKSVMVGYFGNNVLPFRLGELLRAYVAERLTGLGVVKILPTIVADRIIDLFSFFLVFIFMSMGMALPSWAGKTKWALFILIVVIVILLYIYKIQSYRLTLWLAGHNNRFARIVKELHLSLASLFAMDDYLKIIFSSLLLWFIYGIHYFVGFQAFGFDLTLGQAALVLAASTFAVSIPSAPGALGTYHSGLVAILLFLGIEKSQGLAFAVMMHLSGFVPITILGLIYFLQSGVRLREVRSEK